MEAGRFYGPTKIFFTNNSPNTWKVTYTTINNIYSQNIPPKVPPSFLQAVTRRNSPNPVCTIDNDSIEIKEAESKNTAKVEKCSI